jgi:multiple sugar transport system permease protein
MFQFLLLTMMIPGTVTMTATRLMYDTIGWIGTPAPVMIPGMFGGIGTVFFLRQYMKGIPDDLIGAAKIDGMSEIRIFVQLILPLSVPALLTQGVLGFIGHYNDYMGALLYLIDEPLYTLQIAIKNLADIYRTDLPAQMAAAFLGMMPMLILYLLLQNYILKGISMSSGLKG